MIFELGQTIWSWLHPAYIVYFLASNEYQKTTLLAGLIDIWGKILACNTWADRNGGGVGQGVQTPTPLENYKWL